MNQSPSDLRTSPATPGASPAAGQRRRQVRLVLALCLYALWTLLMAAVVVSRQETVLVSRPQLLVAPLVVEAEVAAVGERVRVQPSRVWRGQELVSAKEPGTGAEVTIIGLDQVQGWRGSGVYVLALQPASVPAAYEVVPIPDSPGFSGRDVLHRPLRVIYPATPPVQRQVREALELAGL